MSNPSEKVFKILKGFGYPVKVYDENGNETIDPAQGVRFFVENPNLMVTTLDNEVKLNKSSTVELSDIELLTKQLKNVAREYMMRYSLKVYGKSIAPKDFSFEAKIKRNQNKNKTMESSMNIMSESLLGKLFGRMKTSYQTLGEVKITYKHKVAVNEDAPSSRIRNVKSITLEHAGIKYAYPCVHIDGARAMARHLSEGGMWTDLAGTQIQETSQKHKKLVEFVKYAKRNKLVSESNSTIYHLIEKKVAQIKNELREFVSSKDYESQRNKFESIRLAELQTDRVSALKDDFTVKHFDAQLEDILPVINNILQEKEDYEKSLLEEIGKGLHMSRSFAIPEALTFETNHSKFAYYLEETANCLENAIVSAFMKTLSEKIVSGDDLEEFEYNALKEAFGKINKKPSIVEAEASIMDEFEDRIDELAEADDHDDYEHAKTLGYKGTTAKGARDVIHHDLDQQRLDRKDAAAAKARPVQTSVAKSGSAPNGQPYNGVSSSTCTNKEKCIADIRSFYNVHWGAKILVDADVMQNDDSSFTVNIYYVDRHAENAPDSASYQEADSEDLINKVKGMSESSMGMAPGEEPPMPEDDEPGDFDQESQNGPAGKHKYIPSEQFAAKQQLAADIKELETALGRKLTPDELEMLSGDEQDNSVINMPGDYGQDDNDFEIQ